MRLLFCILLASGFLLAGCRNKSATGSGLEMHLVMASASTNTEDIMFTNLLAVGDADVQELLHVQKAPVIDESDVSSAEIQQYPGNTNLYIQITFTDEGGRRLAQVTRENIGRRIAMMVDGDVIAAPIIYAEISGGAALITGRFSKAEAKALVHRVKSAIKK